MQKLGHNHKQWKTEAKLRQWAFVNHWFPLPFLFALWFVLVFVRNKTWRSGSRWRSQHCVTSCRCMECSPLRAGIVLGTFWRESYSLPDCPAITLYILKALVIKTCELLQYIVMFVWINKPNKLNSGIPCKLVQRFPHTSLKFSRFCRKQCKTSARHIQLRTPDYWCCPQSRREIGCAKEAICFW